MCPSTFPPTEVLQLGQAQRGEYQGRGQHIYSPAAQGRQPQGLAAHHSQISTLGSFFGGVSVDTDDAEDGVADTRQLTVHWEIKSSTLGGDGWVCGNAQIAQDTYKWNVCELRDDGVI